VASNRAHVMYVVCVSPSPTFDGRKSDAVSRRLWCRAP
jgi:hypothetical protein